MMPKKTESFQGQRAVRAGTETMPKRRRGDKPANPAATTFWHQGFATIKVPVYGVVVPFITQATAERIATQATTNGHGWMRVVKIDVGWGYLK